MNFTVLKKQISFTSKNLKTKLIKEREKRMKKLFKRILLSAFVIGASLFIGNNVFAENYKVNIAVVGSRLTGKTQIIGRIFGDPFVSLSQRTAPWDHGAEGRQKQYRIGGDVFECKYYDAPGYLRMPHATLDQQIESAAIRDANIALIVLDPQQTAGIEPRYKSALHEAFSRYADHVQEVNPNCKIIVVANKIDEITDPSKSAEYKKCMQGFRVIYDHCNADGVFTSAKTGEGIPELKEKITDLLALNKATFPTFDDRFVDCKCGHCKRLNECEEGYNHDLYCGLGCLTLAEAKPCERQGCPNKDRFLRCRAQGFTDIRTGKMYCDIECYKKAVGKKCDHKGCDKWFVIADGQDGVDFFTHKNGKRYCPEHSEDANSTCTLL